MTSLTLGIVLDRSGSMYVAWDDTVGSLNTMLDEQAAEGDTLFVPTVFDGDIDHLDVVKAGEGNPVEGIAPRGSTALYDAIVQAVRRVEEYEPENEKTAVVIVTDGHENASKEATLETVNDLISKKRDLGWEFIFIGANQDAWGTGSSMGIATTMDWNQTTEGTRAVYNQTSQMLTSYRNG